MCETLHTASLASRLRLPLCKPRRGRTELGRSIRLRLPGPEGRTSIDAVHVHELKAQGKGASEQLIMQDMKLPHENRPLRCCVDKCAILRDHCLLGKLAPQHIDRLSTCIVTKSVKRGTNIFAKGDPGTSLFAIAAGTVKISVPSVEGKDAVFNLLGKGDIFGEIALL